MPFTRDDGTKARRIMPYIIDLGSGNGTFLNEKKIEPQRYIELQEKDMLKFGFSTREYVVMKEREITEEELAEGEDVKKEESDWLFFACLNCFSFCKVFCSHFFRCWNCKILITIWKMILDFRLVTFSLPLQTIPRHFAKKEEMWISYWKLLSEKKKLVTVPFKGAHNFG